jgi:peptidyl-prolyl cis-trans isomerase C
MTVKRFIPLVATLAGVAWMFASSGTAQAADNSAADKPLVTVNGTPLTTKDLNAFTKAMSASRTKPVPRQEAMKTLIDRELLYQEALAKGLDKDPDVKQELFDQRRSLLANIAISDMLRARPATDKELHQVYQQRVLAKKVNEYKARHILVKTEGEAKDIIAQLDKGADFAALAKAKSIDTGSGAKGGELGWFSPGQMVPEFSAATAKLAKGKYTKTPVRSKFGWHVIQLEDTRPVKPPTFDEIKPRLEGVVQSERITTYVNDLRKKAKIVDK